MGIESDQSGNCLIDFYHKHYLFVADHHSIIPNSYHRAFSYFGKINKKYIDQEKLCTLLLFIQYYNMDYKILFNLNYKPTFFFEMKESPSFTVLPPMSKLVRTKYGSRYSRMDQVKYVEDSL